MMGGSRIKWSRKFFWSRKSKKRKIFSLANLVNCTYFQGELLTPSELLKTIKTKILDFSHKSAFSSEEKVEISPEAGDFRFCCRLWTAVTFSWDIRFECRSARWKALVLIRSFLVLLFSNFFWARRYTPLKLAEFQKNPLSPPQHWYYSIIMYR